MLQKGDLFNERYIIKAELGIGGMGIVYLAEDTTSNSLIALKILKAEFSSDPTLVKRFLNEGSIGQKLSYDHLVKIYDYTRSKDGQYYITMEYIEGGSLRDLIDDGEDSHPLSFSKIPDILRELARPLHYIHSKGIVHRDLKPENILITNSNKIKLTDFGIALSLQEKKRITVDYNQVLGTMQYLSPEQWGEIEIDQRADIYAFGVIAFEMATGNVPFEYTSIHNLENELGRDTIPQIAGKNGIPYWFQDFLEKCLDPDRNRRFQSMQEVLDVLEDNNRSIHLPRGLLKLKRRVAKIRPGIRNAFLAFLFSLLILVLTCPLPGKPYSGFVGLNWEPKLMDMWFTLRGPIEPPEEVVIVSIDDDSYQRLNVGADALWPRPLLTKALRAISSGSPRRIAIDIRFLSLADSSEDLALADAIAESKAFLGEFIHYKPGWSRDGQNVYSEQWLKSHPFFSEKAAGAFFGNISKQSGIARKFAFRAGSSKNYPPIADLIFGKEHLPKRLPLPSEFINYYGPAGTINNVSFHQVISDESGLAPEFFRNKVVLIGKQLFIRTREDKSDVHLIPNNQEMWGVEIHANAVGNLLQGNWIKRLPVAYEYLSLMLLSALLCFLILNLSYIAATSLFVSVLLGWPIISFVLFRNNSFFPATCMSLMLGLAFLPRLLFYFLRLRKRRRLFTRN